MQTDGRHSNLKNFFKSKTTYSLEFNLVTASASIEIKTKINQNKRLV